MKRNQVSDSVLNAGDALQHVRLAIVQNSVSENYKYLLSEVKTKRLDRILKSACFVENVPWYVPEESTPGIL